MPHTNHCAIFVLLSCMIAVSVAVSSNNWGNSRRDSYHSGFASAVSPSFVPAKNWTVTLSTYPEGVISNPVVDNTGNIYYAIMGADKSIVRIDSYTAGGSFRWKSTLQLVSLYSLLFLQSENVLIAVGGPIYSGYTAFWTVSVNDGTAKAGGLLLGAGTRAVLSPSDNSLYTAIDNFVFKTDFLGKNIMWKTELHVNTSVSVLSVTPDGESLIAVAILCRPCSQPTYLYGIDAATGKPTWQNSAPSERDYRVKNAVYNPVSDLWILDNWNLSFAAVSPNNGTVLYNFVSEGVYCFSAQLGAIDPVSGQIYGICGEFYTSFDANGKWLWNGGQVIGNNGGIIPSISVRSPYSQGANVMFGTGAQSNGYLWGFYPDGKLAAQIAVQTNPVQNIIDTFIIGTNVYVRYFSGVTVDALQCYTLSF